MTDCKIKKTNRHTQHIATVSTVVSSMISRIQSVSKSIGYIHQFSITFRGHPCVGEWFILGSKNL
uniref:Uncharacterized protein n=1 Tax=Glossina palpalis gambiensis TaxID=67801 RepID=A0A1B0AW83_9MUSC